MVHNRRQAAKNPTFHPPPAVAFPLLCPHGAEKTRYTCASALCKMALRLPEPVRFDAYCFLKGLADAASLFPLVGPHGESDPPAVEACSGAGRARLLDVYKREQEVLSERIENGEDFKCRVGVPGIGARS